MLILFVAFALMEIFSRHHPPATLELLCSDKPFELTDQTQVLQLAGELERSPQVECPAHVRAALAELATILKEPKEKLCTSEVTERVRDFYLKYLDSSKDRLRDFSEVEKVDEGDDDKEVDEESAKKDEDVDDGQEAAASGAKKDADFQRLPKPLKKFVVGHAMQLSNVCRWRMFDVLAADCTRYETLLDEKDVKRLGKLADPEGPLSKLLEEMNEPGDIILPKDLTELLKLNDTIPLETLYIQTKYTSTIRRIQHVCQQRFKPVYDAFVMPITALTSVGYNYRDKELKAQFQNKKLADRVRQWSRIVFLCEGMAMVEPIEWHDGETWEEVQQNRELTVVARQSDKKAEEQQTLRLLTKEEADTFRQNVWPREADDFEKLTKFELDPRQFDIQKDLPDVILDRADWRLARAVGRVRTRRSALGRIKARMIRTAIGTLKKNLASGHVKLLLTAPVKALWRRLTNNRSKQSKQTDELMAQINYLNRAAWKSSFKFQRNEVVEKVLVLILYFAIFKMAELGLMFLIITFFGGAIAHLFG